MGYCLVCRGSRGGILYFSRPANWETREPSNQGYPERFAQEALGHNSKAVHRAYAKKAQVRVPSLEEYEGKAKIPGVHNL